MHNHAHDEYLVTQVMTATPQKLHLLLIEAALRQCQSARQKWSEDRDDLAAVAIEKAQEIITELIASLNYGEQPELSRRIAGVYNFVFRSLVTAHLHRDEMSLADAVRLLEIERDTWRQIVQKNPEAAASSTRTQHASHPMPAPVRLTDAPTASFSFEA